MSTRSLGNLVVRLALELAQYKAGWQEAEAATKDGAAKVDQANQAAAKGADTLKEALKRQAGAYGEAAGGAMDLAGAAQAATGASAAAVVGVGAVVGVVAALGYAAYQGAKEQQALNNSLLLTGNYAGLVSGQLDQMALSVAGSIGGTVGNAREVLAGLVGTGRFTVESLGSVGEAVQLVAQYSGQTNAQVLKDFAGMADGVAKWAAKSNEAYHFLTIEQYRHIKALEEQGRVQEAMAATADTLADHLKGNLTQNLGVLERAWLGVTAAASKAWAAMKDIGKDQGIDAQIAAAAQRLENAKRGLAARSASGQDAIAAQETELRTLMRRKEILDSNAQAQSANAQATERGIAADKRADQIAAQYSTTSEKRTKALDEVRKVAQEAGKSVEWLAEQEKKINQSFDKKGRRGPSEGEKEAERERRLLAELSGVQADYMADLSRLNKLRQEGTLSEEEYVAAVTKLIEKQPMAKALMKAQADEAERVAKANAEAARAHEAHVNELTKGIDKLEKEVDAQRRHNEALGLSKEAVAELDAAKLEEQATSLEGLAIRKLEKDLDQGLYDLRMREAAQLRELANLKRSGAAKETAIDEAKAAAKAWGETGEFIQRALYDGVQEGLRDGEHFAKSFFKSLVATAKTTVLRFGVQFVGQGLTGMVGSVMGGGNAAPAAGMLGNLGSLGGLLGGMGTFGGGLAAGFGGLTGSIGSLFGMAGTGTTLGGALSAGTTALGMGNIMGGLGTIAGALGPIALGVMAIASLFDSKGGPKTETGYTPIKGLDTYAGFDGSEYERDTTAAKQMSDTIAGAYAGVARTLGIKDGKLDVALFVAQDPEGDAKTILQVASGNYNRGDRLGGVENVGREEEDLKRAIAEETTRVIFAEIAASEELSDQLRTVMGDTNAYTSTLEEITATLDRMSKVSTERAALEEALYQLTATDAEKLTRARDAERAAVDETNRALLEQVFAEQDLAAATAAAAAAAEDAARKQEAIANERYGLETQLLQLQGNTEELRRRELETLDESNRALQEEIWALEDAAAAAQNLASNVNDAFNWTGLIAADQGDIALAAATAAAEAANAWEETAKTIRDAMAKLRGEMIGFEEQNYAKAQADFAIATAKARAGDRAAADSLPALAQLLAQLSSQNAGSAFEANAGIAAILASLGTTLATIPSYDVGTPYVPRTGLALVHEGEEITPAYRAQARRAAQASNDSNVRVELAAWREDARAQAVAHQQALVAIRKSLDVLKQWEHVGMPETRPAA
jgi:phage-related minor tail protein